MPTQVSKDKGVQDKNPTSSIPAEEVATSSPEAEEIESAELPKMKQADSGVWWSDNDHSRWTNKGGRD